MIRARALMTVIVVALLWTVGGLLWLLDVENATDDWHRTLVRYENETFDKTGRYATVTQLRRRHPTMPQPPAGAQLTVIDGGRGYVLRQTQRREDLLLIRDPAGRTMCSGADEMCEQLTAQTR